MGKLVTYFKESFAELQENVTWSEWPELNKSAVMVIAVTVLSSAFIFAVDKVIEVVLENIYL